ncbi:unnamed protein product [Tetraodon nigroviridis]|uniref:(spotted green pufferfish) hypothetical protein n=1 Tax=Tetraodon nigroviridis TaxID=99883 RepID=Q4T8M9_TETNG|nr:unnamed protein product [Tetraodon nigroviridis]
MDREQFNKIFDELDKDRIKEHPPVPQYNSPVLQRLQEIFSHYYLTIFGNIVALANVLCIGTVLVLNAEKSIAEKDNVIMQVNTQHTLLIYHLCKSNLYCVCVFVCVCVWDPTSNNVISLWDMVSFINMLIVFRFLRIIPNIKLMALVAGTLLDLVKNLRAFAGILVVSSVLLFLFPWRPPATTALKGLTVLIFSETLFEMMSVCACNRHALVYRLDK